MAIVANNDDLRPVHREPHPFVSKDQIAVFVGKTVAFVGKVVSLNDSTMMMETSDGKS